MGRSVRVNTPLFTLVKTTPVRLRVEAPERTAPWVQTGRQAEVYVEAYPERRCEGRLRRISPTVDQSKRTFLAEAPIRNAGGELKPGSNARARIRMNRFEQVHVARARAVAYVLGSDKVYAVRGGAVAPREVKVGDRLGQEVEVFEGVRPGDPAAVTRPARLEGGVGVRLVQEGGVSE